MRLWYLSHRRPATAQKSLCICAVSPEPLHTWSVEVDEGSDKNQTSSPTGWLLMHVWRMSLWRMKSAIISWDGSYGRNFAWEWPFFSSCLSRLKIFYGPLTSLMMITKKLWVLCWTASTKAWVKRRMIQPGWRCTRPTWEVCPMGQVRLNSWVFSTWLPRIASSILHL